MTEPPRNPMPEEWGPARRPVRVDRRFQPVDEDDEPMGGDPACWAHLFEDEDEAGPDVR